MKKEQYSEDPNKFRKEIIRRTDGICDLVMRDLFLQTGRQYKKKGKWLVGSNIAEKHVGISSYKGYEYIIKEKRDRILFFNKYVTTLVIYGVQSKYALKDGIRIMFYKTTNEHEHLIGQNMDKVADYFREEFGVKVESEVEK